MNFWDFRNQFSDLGCFGIHQVRALYPGFQSNNLTRWTAQNRLIKLRQGHYAFSENLGIRDFAFFVSNRIYRPSYISLHTALSFYGMIPEAVTQISAVSTLKTSRFSNSFGTYSYKNIKESLFWGYELLPFADRTILFASPEKALLDLLYLYPFYNSSDDLAGLRLDDDFMREELNLDLLNEYLRKFDSEALTRRVRTLLSLYEL